MPRPKKCRRIGRLPQAVHFKPRGVPLRELTEVYLRHEGLEAIRLVDLEGLNQQSAADSMGVSRHTLGRILSEARSVVARALVEGRALRIDGGDYRLDDEEAAEADDSNREPLNDADERRKK